MVGSQMFRRTMPVLLLTSLGFLLRIFNIGVQGFWYDEAYTLFIARLPLIEALRALVADGVHPPLFYLIQRVALIFGKSEAVFRLPSMIFGVLAIPFLYWLVVEWVDEHAGFLAGLLLALSPFHIWYSQEARMYTLLLMMVVVCMFAYRMMLRGQGLVYHVVFIAASTILYLTHYFGLMLPLIQLTHLGFHVRRYPRLLRVWVVEQTLAIIPFLGWVYTLAQRPGQSFGIGWIAAPQWRDLGYTLINLIVGYTRPLTLFHWFGLGVSILLVVLGVRCSWRWPEGRILTIIWAFLPMVLIFMLSFSRPTYVDRFFIISLPALLMLIVAGVVSLGQRRAITFAVVLVLLFTIGISKFSFGNDQQKEEWREAAAYITKAHLNETIVIRVLQMVVPLSYYYEGPLRLEAMEVNRQITPLAELARGHSGLWLLYWNAMSDPHLVTANPPFDPSSEVDPVAADWIAGRGPVILEQKDFRGVTVFHFQLHP